MDDDYKRSETINSNIFVHPNIRLFLCVKFIYYFLGVLSFHRSLNLDIGKHTFIDFLEKCN